MSETDRVLSSLNELILAGGSGGGGSTGSVRPGMSPSASIVNFSASSLPNSMEGLIWKYSTKEIAEQLTFIDSTFIRALPLHEFVATKWVKKELAPNVTRMAVRCTHMVFFFLRRCFFFECDLLTYFNFLRFIGQKLSF